MTLSRKLCVMEHCSLHNIIIMRLSPGLYTILLEQYHHLELPNIEMAIRRWKIQKLFFPLWRLFHMIYNEYLTWNGNFPRKGSVNVVLDKDHVERKWEIGGQIGSHAGTSVPGIWEMGPSEYADSLLLHLHTWTTHACLFHNWTLICSVDV